MFRDNVSFEGEELLAPRPKPKLKNDHLSVRDCCFSIFAPILNV